MRNHPRQDVALQQILFIFRVIQVSLGPGHSLLPHSAPLSP